MDQSGRVSGSPDGGGDHALWEGTKFRLQRSEGVRRNDVMIDRGPQSEHMEDEALNPLSMGGGCVAWLVRRGGPVKAKGRSMDCARKLGEAVHNLGISRGAHAHRENRVGGQRGGKAMQNGKGGVRCTSWAALEKEVEGRQLDSPRARCPGEGEPSSNNVTGSPHHAVAPEPMGEECQGETVGGTRVSSAVDAENSQVTADG